MNHFVFLIQFVEKSMMDMKFCGIHNGNFFFADKMEKGDGLMSFTLCRLLIF